MRSTLKSPFFNTTTDSSDDKLAKVGNLSANINLFVTILLGGKGFPFEAAIAYINPESRT